MSWEQSERGKSWTRRCGSFAGFAHNAKPLANLKTNPVSLPFRRAYPPETETTLIVLRHTDRQGLEGDLSKKGRARAEALVLALRDFEIDAIYSPGIQRNLDTAAPLSSDVL